MSLPTSHHFFTILTGYSTPVHIVSNAFDPVIDKLSVRIMAALLYFFLTPTVYVQISWIKFFVTIILPFDTCHTSQQWLMSGYSSLLINLFICLCLSVTSVPTCNNVASKISVLWIVLLSPCGCWMLLDYSGKVYSHVYSVLLYLY